MAVARNRQSRWVGFAGFGFALLVAAFGVWLMQASDRVVGFDAHRNDHDLRIVADGLASWPGTLGSMARSNFLPQRLEPAALAEQERGWQARARFWHPELGRFAIRYALVAAAAPCPDADRSGRRSWFAGDTMEFRDRLDLAQLEAADRQLLPTIGPDYRAWLTAPRPNRPPVQLGSGGSLCYAAGLPLAALVHLSVSAPKVANLLLADAKGRVEAQIGDEPLPISDLGRLPRSQSLTTSVLAGVPGAPKASAGPLPFDALDPVRTHAGERDYTAYVREIVLPGVDDATPQLVRAVALVPNERLLAQIPRSPIIVAGFGVPLLLLLGLTVAIKLRLIGPGEALHRLEIAALGIGIIGAVALVTTAVAFAVDVELSRARAGARTAHTALALREQFRQEVAPLLALRDAATPMPVPPDGRWWDARRCADTMLPLTSVLSAPDPGYPVIERRRNAFIGPTLPARESVFVVGRDGLLLPGTAISACRSNNGGRLDVSRRDYFNRAVEGSTLAAPDVQDWVRLSPPGPPGVFRRTLLVAPRYAIEQVRSQSDGIDKTLIAFPAIVTRAPGPGGGERGANAVLVSAAVLRSLLSPVLPPTESFMVIDLDTPGFEVIFHSDRRRVHFEQARRELQNPRLAQVVEALRSDTGGTAGTSSLTSTYDGKRQHFEMAHLPFTNWAIVTWHSHDSADEVPATVLFGALRTFSMVTMLVWGLPLLIFGLFGRIDWSWLWPDMARSAVYPRATRLFAAIAATGLLTLFVLPTAAIWTAVLCWLAAAIAVALIIRVPPESPATTQRGYRAILAVALAGTPRGKRGALSLSTQRNYRFAVVAALAAFVVVPMLAFHVDAARFGRRVVDSTARDALDAGLAARRAATASIANVYYSDPGGARVRPNGRFDNVGVVAGCWQSLPAPAAQPGLAQRLYRFLSSGPPPGAVVATPEIIRQSCDGAPLEPGVFATYAEPRLSWVSGTATRLAWVLVMVGLAVAVIGFSLGVTFRRLFGLATPLEAVTYPPLRLSDDFAQLELPPKVMIIRPPLGLRNLLFDNGHRVDLSNETPTVIAGGAIAKAWEAPRHYILYNIELTLRDPERRRAALRFIEGLADRSDVRAGTATLVLVSELTPLERLLQAYEHEKIGALDAAAGELEAIRRQREDIRWAKLLEGFQTFIFAHVDKLECAARPGESEVDIAVIRELAVLPEQVIATLLPLDQRVPVAPGVRTIADFDRLYRPPVLAFARSLNAVSPQAAIDFIGLMLIEHYQQLWSASSRPEQLVLANLALRRLPSIAARDALKSLIRRALVVFDPVPRLMNRSFAAFVLHAERPQTMQRWRTEAPRGGWRFAAWPLLVVLPLGLLLLGYAILDSSQTLLALLPLLLATGPALLQTLGVFKKATT